MRVLGIDFGEKRIGLAITDSLGCIAQSLETLEHKNKEDGLKRLEEIVKEYNVEEIVLGLPLNMNGSKGEKAEEVINFSKVLKDRIRLPIKLWDERLSTLESKRILLEADLSRGKRRKVQDKLAAQLILQNYLDANV